MSKKHRGKQRYQTFITVVVAALTPLLRLSQFTSNKQVPYSLLSLTHGLLHKHVRLVYACPYFAGTSMSSN